MLKVIKTMVGMVLFIVMQTSLADSQGTDRSAVLSPAAEPKMFAVWLMPRKQEAGFFSAIIKDFAERYHAQMFTPHVTIYFGETNSLEKVQQAIQFIASRSGPVALEIDGAGTVPSKFSTVFVTFKSNASLTHWSEEIGKFTVNNNYHLSLHMSVLYKDVSLEETKQLAEALALEKTQIIFDKIILIRMDDPNDVNKWVPIYELDITAK